MLEKELLKAGFSDKEARVYLASLELGETSIGRLAKKSGVKRTTVYLAIESLKEKGYISSIKKRNKTVFFAEDPRKLHELMEDNKKSIDKIIPELLSFSNSIDKKPKIRYFEGKEGIKEIYKETLKYPNQEMCSWFSESAYNFDEKFFSDFYWAERTKKRIWVRAIVPDNKKTREMIEKNDQKYIRKSKLVKSEKFKMPVDITLYSDNQVGLFSYEEELGVIIESKKIQESLKSIFEVMWELL